MQILIMIFFQFCRNDLLAVIKSSDKVTLKPKGVAKRHLINNRTKLYQKYNLMTVDIIAVEEPK